LSVEEMLDIWNAELKQFADEEDTYNVDSSRMSVHVLNHWKSELSKELGLGVSYKGKMETFGQDIFRGRKGSILYVFYCKFAPADVINDNRRMFNEAGSNLHTEDNYDIDECFDFDHDLAPTAILNGLGLLKQKNDMNSRHKLIRILKGLFLCGSK